MVDCSELMSGVLSNWNTLQTPDDVTAARNNAYHVLEEPVPSGYGSNNALQALAHVLRQFNARYAQGNIADQRSTSGKAAIIDALTQGYRSPSLPQNTGPVSGANANNNYAVNAPASIRNNNPGAAWGSDLAKQFGSFIFHT